MQENALWIIPVIIGVGALVMLALVIGFVVLVIKLVQRNAAAAEEAGLDPWAAGTQIQGRIYNSPMLNGDGAPAASLEERLGRIEDLLAQGLITQQERDQARQDLLRQD